MENTTDTKLPASPPLPAPTGSEFRKWPYDYGQTMAASLGGFHPVRRSSCCGAKAEGEGAIDTGICPDCHDPCTFEDERG